MEGNLSLAEAKAAVSDEDDLETDILELTESDVEQQDEGAWATSNNRRKYLLFGSVGASLFWLTVFAAGIFWLRSAGLMGDMSVVTIAGLITALGVPLCLIWIISLVLQRSDPLLERRLAIARTLQASIAPVDAAEAKLDRMLERLQRDIGTVDQTVLLASERIGALEDRFKDQVSQLFSATTDAEAKSASIREQLRRERGSVESLIEVLADHLSTMRQTIAEAADKTRETETMSREAFDQAAKTFEGQYTSLLSASNAATKGISAAMNGLAERTTALDAATLAATQKIGKGAAALKAHEQDYSGFVARFAENFKAFDSVIDARLVALEAAQNRLDKAGSHTATTLDDLGSKTSQLIDGALEKTASASKALDTHRENVGVFVEETLSALSSTQADYLANIETFKAHTQALSDQATQHIKVTQAAHDNAAKELFQAVQRHTDQWSDELSRFNLVVSDSTERAGTIAAARIEQAKTGLLESLETLSHASHARMASMQDDIANRTQALTKALSAQEAAYNQHSGRIEAQAKAFDGVSETLGAAVNTANEDIAQLRGVLDQNIADLGNAAKGQASEIVSQLSEISQQTQALEKLPEAVTQQWMTALQDAREAGDEIAAKSEAQFASISKVASDMRAASETVTQTMANSVDALEDITARLDQNTASVTDRMGTVQDMIAAIEGSTAAAKGELKDLTSGFEHLRALADDISTNDLHTLTSAHAQMEQAINSFEAMAGALREKASTNTDAILAAYKETLGQASQLAQQTDNAARQASQSIAQSANKAIDLARLKWSKFSEDKQKETVENFEAIAQALHGTINDTASQIEKRLHDLNEHSSITLEKLSTQASDATQKNKDTLERVEQLTKRVDTYTTGDLIRASSLIVDALNSLSIDINKSLHSKLSDEDWATYLAGDKSIFTRKTVQAMTKAERHMLRERLERDADLKETVYRYLRDFELLMARAMRGNEPTSLSVALVSSDIGKLYVALSQSVRRLN